jgi:F-type H+-transporting ATPase subunit delta
MVEVRVAKRYAQALLDLAIEKNKLDEVYKDVNSFLEVAKSHHDFLALLRSPVIGSWKKLPIVNAIFKGKISDLTLSFLEFVVKKDREEVVLVVAEEFIAMYLEYKNMAKAKVISAIALDAAVIADVKAKLEAKTGKSIIVETTIDKEILGGIVVKIGDKIIDKSVMSMLTRLKLEFNGGSYIAN